MFMQNQTIEKLRSFFSQNGLAVDQSNEEGEAIEKMPALRRMTQMFKAKEVRDLVGSLYSNVDLLVGGTFSGMPVVGIFTLADELTETKLTDIFKNDILKTESLWTSIQDQNYFSNWKDWALYYNNTVSALSGIFCLRFFIFSDSEKYQKMKDLIRTMKSRQMGPMLGVYCFACDSSQGEVLAPKFTFWFGAGALHPKKIAKALK